ncbi:hypothetical protein ATANTOWER_005918 [Ataeniobius toweri]|uniref:Uncharacterized protein n=1 Tax=Ataeniobius toweri TaxID=208326 RepID=A0ABU7AME1_9TELE|nr:hypothetical protein [Ataeniobius toweri]
MSSHLVQLFYRSRRCVRVKIRRRQSAAYTAAAAAVRFLVSIGVPAVALRMHDAVFVSMHERVLVGMCLCVEGLAHVCGQPGVHWCCESSEFGESVNSFIPTPLGTSDREEFTLEFLAAALPQCFTFSY